MAVRPARPKDVKEITKLTIQMHNHLGQLVGIEFSADDLEDEFFAESESLAGVYVAEDDRKVVGCISFSERIHEDEWSRRHYGLDHLIVDEKHRRKGFGTELLRILLQTAQKDNVNVVVDTFTKNKGTIAFFKSFGFKPLETIFLLDKKKETQA